MTNAEYKQNVKRFNELFDKWETNNKLSSNENREMRLLLISISAYENSHTIADEIIEECDFILG